MCNYPFFTKFLPPPKASLVVYAFSRDGGFIDVVISFSYDSVLYFKGDSLGKGDGGTTSLATVTIG